MRTIILGAALAAAVSTPALALPDEITGPAQAEMFKRIDKRIATFVELSGGIDPSLVSYCRTKMSLDTRHATDGSIPFGVNYRTLESTETLKIVIETREAFEWNYMRLCLADALRTLEVSR